MNIPNRLECSYCIRNYRHGGECNGKKSFNDIEGCLIFKVDKRGCIKNRDFKLPVALFQNIPPLGCWIDGYILNDLETEIRINKIYNLSWDKERGYLFIHCNCDYFVNEYEENYKENTKWKLTLIK